MTVVLVDGENVRRSTWPNVGREALVGLCRDWAAREGLDLRLVFDGDAPSGAVPSGSESADDRIARDATELADRGEPYWLVTSDRELRARAGRPAERTIGGGSFLRELQGAAQHTK
jgi:hypothetical protein